MESMGTRSLIDQSHKSRNAPVSYPTMYNSEQKCAHFYSEWSIVGYGAGAFWGSPGIAGPLTVVMWHARFKYRTVKAIEYRWRWPGVWSLSGLEQNGISCHLHLFHWWLLRAGLKHTVDVLHFYQEFTIIFILEHCIVEDDAVTFRVGHTQAAALQTWPVQTWWRYGMTCLPYYWPFVRGIHRWPYTGQ